MRLRYKFLLAQAPLAVILAFVGALAVYTLHALGSSSKQILADNYRSVLALQQMNEALERMDGAIPLILAGQRKRGLEQGNHFEATFESQLKIQEDNVVELGEGEATRDLHKRWEEYRRLFDQVTALTSRAEITDRYFNELRPIFYDLKNRVYSILALNQDSMVQKSDRVEALAATVTVVMILAAIGAVILGTYISILLTTRLLRPLSQLTQATRRLGEGDLEVRAAIGSGDEFADLSREFNLMADKLKQYRDSSLGELLQAQSALLAALDSLPDPALVFGIDGVVTNANQAAFRLLGVRDEVGIDPMSEVPEPARSAIQNLVRQVLAGEGPYVPKNFAEAIKLRKGSEEFILLPRASPVYESGSGGIVGATMILQDVTRLSVFDQLKNDLMATVAHEFRTPLTSLHMAVHLCLEEVAGPLTEKQADLLYAAREDCERLQTMVDNLLDLTRLEAGRVEMHRVQVDVASLIDTALEDVRSQIAERNVTVDLEIAPLLEEVNVDPERFVHVFSNLIGNAVRHSPDGGKVVVRVRATEHCLRCEVHDEGPGIAPEHQPHVFEKFYRVPGMPSGGAGLGLSITREIVLAHGGDIGVQSAPPTPGCTFWFTIPLPKSEEAEGEAAEAEAENE